MDYYDPQNGRANGYPSEGFYSEEPLLKGGSSYSTFSIKGDSLTGSKYTHNSRFNNSTILDGIDVSAHQDTIDWDKVKASGIDFVILRAGYRGWGSSGTYNRDTKFQENIEAAHKRGIDVGAYFFSQAITKEEGIAEAEYFLGLVKGYEFELPLIMDFEYASDNSGNKGRLYDANLTKTEATAVVSAFCDTIEERGYTAMVYANKSMLQDDLYYNQLQSKYPIWLANYTTKTSYEGEYSYWQYSDSGEISGVSGYVDSNFRYVDSPNKVANLKLTINTNTSGELTWGKLPGVYGYEVHRKGPGESEYKKIDFVVGAARASYTDKSLTDSGDYSYKVRGYYKLSSGNVYGSFSEPASSSIVGGPAQVVGLTAGESTTNSLSFKWNEVSDATGYVIYSYDNTKENYTKIATIKDPSTLSYTHISLPSGTAYKYKVKAYKNVDGKNLYGEFSTAITMATRPVKVTGMSFSTVDQNSVTLTWKKQTGITGYRVYRYDEKSGKYVALATFTGSSNNSYKDTNLESGIKYIYKVRAYKKGGDSYFGDASNEFAVYTTTSKGVIDGGTVNIRKGAGDSYSVITSASRYQQATILSKVRDSSGELWYRIKFSKGGTSYTGYVISTYFKLIPDTVKGFKIDGSTTSTASISWSPMDGSTGYVVYRYDASKDTYIKLAVLKGKGKTSYTDENLGSSKVYKYKVRAYDAVSDKNFYSAYSDAVAVATRPGKISGVKVSSTTSSSVTLTWTKISSATGYQVYMYNAAAGKYECVASFPGASKNSYTITKLNPGTEYKYKVRAYKKGDATAYGVFSSEVAAKTKNAAATVTAEVVNVRAGNSTSYDIVTQVSSGQKVIIIGSSVNSSGETWYRISFTKSGTSYTGYIKSDLVKIG